MTGIPDDRDNISASYSGSAESIKIGYSDIPLACCMYALMYVHSVVCM